MSYFEKSLTALIYKGGFTRLFFCRDKQSNTLNLVGEIGEF